MTSGELERLSWRIDRLVAVNAALVDAMHALLRGDHDTADRKMRSAALISEREDRG